MKLTSKVIAPAIVVVIFGTIAVSAALNQWNTQSNKTPMRYRGGAFQGQYDPADIRGSYSFADVAATFDVPASVLASAFGFEDQSNPGLIMAKDIEAAYGSTEEGEIGPDSLRYFVSLYTGLPYTPEENTRLPKSAVPILSDRLHEDELAELNRRVVDFSGQKLELAPSAAHVEDPNEMAVKGKTTFADLLKWGLTEKEIESVIGVEMGKAGVTVRDHLVGKGLSFGPVRAALQTLVDSK